MIRAANHQAGWTLIELLLVLLVLAVLLGILIPVISAMRRTADSMQRNTQTRGIHQSLVMYSQGNGGYYPGLDNKGNLIDATVEYRFQQLLDANYFTGEYAISPAENKSVWATGTVTSEHYSYAMSDIDAGPGGRINEWKDTLNTQAVTLSDRNIGSDTDTNVESLHNNTPGDWFGAVAYNDNHVVFETTHILPTGYTIFDDAGEPSILQHAADNLFASDSADDAMMIHSGK